jgi:hypothetical protein
MGGKGSGLAASSFLFCIEPSLGGLMFQFLICAPPHVFDVIGFGSTRFVSACPVQPSGHFHD